MASVTSKVIFSLGVILIVSAIGSIYITSIVAQNGNNGNPSSGQSSSSSSQGSSASSGGGGSGQSGSGGGSSGTQSQNGAESSGGATIDTITIPQGAQSPDSGKYYEPPNATVKPNSKITFKNEDSVVHTATADDGSFDTGNIQPGASKTVTISGQGTIPYHCIIHPWMKAKLTVSSSGGNGDGNSGTNNAASGGANAANGSTNNQESGSSNASKPSGAGGNGGSSPQDSGPNSQTTSANGFPYRTSATAFTLLSSSKTDLGTEQENKDNWVTANHDIYGTRHSTQSIIDKSNVKNLQAKWILNSEFPIENPPLIVDGTGYAQNNAMQVIAFDVKSGLNLWKFNPGVADQQSQTIPRGVYSHGITYSDGVVFAPTGANGTIVALNATDGNLLWQTKAIGDPTKGYRLPSPPLVWQDYVIAGSALGDEPPFGPAAKGSITAFNRTNGEMIWNISTVTGQWVSGKNASENGGGTVWSGGSIDASRGILYVPAGNAAPDFDASTRPPPNPYTNSILAIDIKKGQILWHTQTTPFNTHDWDTAWGTSLANVSADNGVIKKVVIGQNKLGNAFALDAATGHVLWNKTLGVQFRTNVPPQPFGSGTIWPGTQYGVEAYNANDGNTSYFAVSNMAFNYFQTKTGTSGHLVPIFDAIENGVGNGTIAAVDIATGKIKWTYNTEFPTWVSPLVTGGIVFSGHITETGKPYEYNNFGAPTNTPLIPSGIVLALDAETGKKLWEFNVGAPIGIGGPSVGNGTLLVTTGSPAEVSSNKGGYIVAFGLPDSSSISRSPNSDNNDQRINDDNSISNNSSSIGDGIPSINPQVNGVGSGNPSGNNAIGVQNRTNGSSMDDTNASVAPTTFSGSHDYDTL